jgi:hypothetical protein
MMRAGRRFIFDAVAERRSQVEIFHVPAAFRRPRSCSRFQVQPIVNSGYRAERCFLRRCAMKEGAIMTKSLVTGMAVCAALAVFVGSAGAHARKHVYAPRAQAVSASENHGPGAPPLSSLPISALSAKGGPLHDCVHVVFPQCGRGYGEPNDWRMKQKTADDRVPGRGVCSWSGFLPDTLMQALRPWTRPVERAHMNASIGAALMVALGVAAAASCAGPQMAAAQAATGGVTDPSPGSCRAAIVRLETALNESLAHGRIPATAPQSVGAMLHHQPTRVSVAEAQRETVARMESSLAAARELRSQGKRSQCISMLERSLFYGRSLITGSPAFARILNLFSAPSWPGHRRRA